MLSLFKRLPTLIAGLALGLAGSGVAARIGVDAPRPLRVAIDGAYAPYAFQSDDGKLNGILVDQWTAWQEKTGIKVELHPLDWDEALRRMRGGEFDVIDSIVATAERQGQFDFTPAYAAVEASIYFRKGISGISDLASLNGFPVGVKAGDQHIERMMAKGAVNLVPFKSNEALVQAAKEGRISVFVADDPSVLYLLNKMGIESQFRHSEPIFRDELRRAVRKGNVGTLVAVVDGFAAVQPRQMKQIENKWFGRTVDRYRAYLTFGVYAAMLAILLIVALAGWNRTLRGGVQRRTADLRALSRRLVELQESERRHLSRELHDRIGQDVTALKINLGIIKSALDAREAKEVGARLDDSTALVQSTMDTIRNVLYELRPPMLDALGLVAALDWYAQEFTTRTKIAVAVRGTERAPRLRPEAEIAFFRIAQEALTNVAKHARAGRIDIALDHKGGECVMTVQDDGIGFNRAASDKSNPGLGLVTMRERAEAVGGRFDIWTVPGGGTRLEVRVSY